MHAIEFEAVAEHHAIRLPEGIPDGARLRVLILSDTPLEPGPGTGLKALLAGVAEGLTNEDLARSSELGREVPEWAS